MDELEISLPKKDKSVNLVVSSTWSEVLPTLRAAWLIGGSPGIVVTSGKDGVHSANSAHYKGQALDLRKFDLQMDPQMFGPRLAKALNQAAGFLASWYVVLEGDHFHVEFALPGAKPNIKSFSPGTFFYMQVSA